MSPLNKFFETNSELFAAEVSDLCSELSRHGEPEKVRIAAIHAFGQLKAGEAIAKAVSEMPENFGHEFVLAMQHIMPISLSLDIDDPIYIKQRQTTPPEDEETTD